MVLKRSSVELYNSDLRQILKEPGEVAAQGWVRYLVWRRGHLVVPASDLDVGENIRHNVLVVPLLLHLPFDFIVVASMSSVTIFTIAQW
jgi:hypothetical protein